MPNSLFPTIEEDVNLISEIATEIEGEKGRTFTAHIKNRSALSSTLSFKHRSMGKKRPSGKGPDELKHPEFSCGPLSVLQLFRASVSAPRTNEFSLILQPLEWIHLHQLDH